jgi:hypothetical protein
MKICEAFKVSTTRPLSALNKVSIAELAQFTHTEICDKYPVAVAEDTIRKEWNFEVEHYHDLNHLDFKKAILWFKDGSSLTFKTQASK